MSYSVSGSATNPNRPDREDCIIAESSTATHSFTMNLESTNGDGNQSDNIQSVLASLSQIQSNFSTMTGSLQVELNRLRALLAEKDQQLESSSMVIRQNEEKMAEMQRDLQSKSKEIETLNVKDADWQNQVMVLRGSNESKQKELVAQRKQSEEKMQALFNEQNTLNEALQNKTTAVESIFIFLSLFDIHSKVDTLSV